MKSLRKQEVRDLLRRYALPAIVLKKVGASVDGKKFLKANDALWDSCGADALGDSFAFVKRQLERLRQRGLEDPEALRKRVPKGQAAAAEGLAQFYYLVECEDKVSRGVNITDSYSDEPSLLHAALVKKYEKDRPYVKEELAFLRTWVETHEAFFATVLKAAAQLAECLSPHDGELAKHSLVLLHSYLDAPSLALSELAKRFPQADFSFLKEAFIDVVERERPQTAVAEPDLEVFARHKTALEEEYAKRSKAEDEKKAAEAEAAAAAEQKKEAAGDPQPDASADTASPEAGAGTGVEKEEAGVAKKEAPAAAEEATKGDTDVAVSPLSPASSASTRTQPLPPTPPTAAEVLCTALQAEAGADAAAVLAVLDKVRSQAEWTELRGLFSAACPALHGGDLVQALRSELRGSELRACETALARSAVRLCPLPPPQPTATPTPQQPSPSPSHRGGDGGDLAARERVLSAREEGLARREQVQADAALQHAEQMLHMQRTLDSMGDQLRALTDGHNKGGVVDASPPLGPPAHARRAGAAAPTPYYDSASPQYRQTVPPLEAAAEAPLRPSLNGHRSADYWDKFVQHFEDEAELRNRL